MHDDFGQAHYHTTDAFGHEQIHPLWQMDRIELRSVGIDIGSSTSHLIFSTLELRRQSKVLSSRFQLVDRRVQSQSPILLTPFVDGTKLDVAALSAFIEQAYADAGWAAASVDTGAVITTGDAARKENAAAVVQLFSEQAGKFVCASAGPLLEAKMAAYGSGAVARSFQDGHACTVLNIDIGGGTSKIAIMRGGRIIEAVAINVGARLVTFDDDSILTKIEHGAEIVAAYHGLGLAVGQHVSDDVKRRLALALCSSLLEVATRRPLSDMTRNLLITPPFGFENGIDIVMLSGGVSEYFYHDDTPTFGDLGPLIGECLRSDLPNVVSCSRIEPSLQGIRATVIGASQFTAQVSGNTLFISKSSLLPQRNLQVVPVHPPVAPTEAGIDAAIRKALAQSEVGESHPIALVIKWPHGPAYKGLSALARGIGGALAGFKSAGLPIILVLDVDLARLVGTILLDELGPNTEIICIDGIDLQEFDYIDISEEHPGVNVVTVIVKSLVFTG